MSTLEIVVTVLSVTEGLLMFILMDMRARIVRIEDYILNKVVGASHE